MQWIDNVVNGQTELIQWIDNVVNGQTELIQWIDNMVNGQTELIQWIDNVVNGQTELMQWIETNVNAKIELELITIQVTNQRLMFIPSHSHTNGSDLRPWRSTWCYIVACSFSLSSLFFIFFSNTSFSLW